MPDLSTINYHVTAPVTKACNCCFVNVGPLYYFYYYITVAIPRSRRCEIGKLRGSVGRYCAKNIPRVGLHRIVAQKVRVRDSSYAAFTFSTVKALLSILAIEYT